MGRIEDLGSRIERVLGYAQHVDQQFITTVDRIEWIEKDTLVIKKAIDLIQRLINIEVEESVELIKQLETDAMQSVFPDQKLSVETLVKIDRNKIAVDILTLHDKEGKIIQGKATELFGGAVATVQSLILRIITIKQNGLRPILLLDETLPALDERYVHNMAALLKTLSELMQVDILLVTHNPIFSDYAHKKYVVSVSKKTGDAELSEV